MKRLLIILSLFSFLIFSACQAGTDSNINNSFVSENKNIKDFSKGILSVSVIDVGQGDSILIKSPNGKFVLIDSGSRNEEEKFFKYISRQNIKKFDAVIATHPHEDHIGSLDEVLINYDVENIYMPKVTSSTSAFQNLMEAVKMKKLKIKNAASGVNFVIDGVNFQFLAPNSTKYDDLNNYSAVLKMTYGKRSFIFMGDAEKLSEEEIIKKGADLKSDVIKIGHHGSSSSSSKSFIKAVSPEFAAISCGKNNDYGHPHKETLKLLEGMNIKTLRTDIEGTLIFNTDGNDIIITTNN